MATLQITVDDGPSPEPGGGDALSTILAEIKKRKVKAAFFVLGNEAKVNSAGIESILKDKHILGNHSWDHLPPKNPDYTNADLLKQFLDTHNVILKEHKVPMVYWRAPRGERVRQITESIVGVNGSPYKLSNCQWHADSEDSKAAKTKDKMLEKIREGLKVNANAKAPRLLFHVLSWTAAELGGVLDALENEGHTFVDFAQAQ